MDSKDVRIFCQMAFKYTDFTAFSHRKVSPKEIGARLGLPERTVRLRVTKMEKEGFIKFYQTIPNFNLFNLGLAMFGYEARDIKSKHEAMERIRNRPGVVEMIDFLGPIFAVTHASPSSERMEEEVARMREEEKLKAAFKLSESHTPQPSLIPSRLDWQIIKELRYDALSSSSRVAAAIRVSKRMVEYRISKLLDGRVFFVKAMIDARRQRGIIFYTLTLFTDPSMKSNLGDALKRLHDDRLWTMYVPRPDLFIVNLFAFTSGEPEDSFLKSMNLPGVKHGSLSILREWLDPEAPSWIDDLIKAKIEAQRKL